MMEPGYSGPSSRPMYLEPEIREAVKDGGQMFQGDAANCAEMRACATGFPEAACISCQSALVRRGATDLAN